MSSGESVEENVEKKRKKKKKHRKMSRSPSPYESAEEPMPPAEEAGSFEHSPVPKKVSETLLKDLYHDSNYKISIAEEKGQEKEGKETFPFTIGQQKSSQQSYTRRRRFLSIYRQFNYFSTYLNSLLFSGDNPKISDDQGLSESELEKQRLALLAQLYENIDE